MPFRDDPDDLDHLGRRRFVVVIACLIVALAGMIALTVVYLDYRNDAEARECRRVVNARDDQRSMWTRTAERLDDLGGGASDIAANMRMDRDELLPRLRCVGNNPVIIEPAE